MTSLPRNMNSAAAMTHLANSMGTDNAQYYGNQAAMNITGQGQNPSLFSGSNPIQHPLGEAYLDLMMVEELLNPVFFYNQAPPQPLPTAFPSFLNTQHQYNMPSDQSQYVYDPAFATLCASGATPNSIMACINNNVASLMQSNGYPDDAFGFRQLLVNFELVQPAPHIPLTTVGNAVTAASIPTLNHNHIILTQSQRFLPQTHTWSFANNAANNGVQISNRRRGSNPEEANQARNRRMRQMIRNRESAARSRARKQAYDIQLQTEVDELRKENDKLKKMLEVKSEIKNGNKKLKRTISWP